jgi:hypothetical protein
MRKEIIVPLIGLTPFVTMIVGVIMAGFGYELSPFLPFAVHETGKAIMGYSAIGMILAVPLADAMKDREARQGR